MTTKVRELDLASADTVLDRGVTALAVDITSTYCAVGRENGNIQVHGLKKHFTLYVLLTSRDCKKNVQGLVWLGEADEKTFPRLFSFGLDGYLREWDVLRQRERYVVDTYGGANWCGALTSPLDVQNSILAIGCEDGTARLFELPEDDEPVYTRAFSCLGIEARVMAICWNDEGNELYTGSSIGVITMFRRGETGSFQRINMAKNWDREAPIVHDLAFLPDGLLASACSHGRVEIWDQKFGTLIRSFHCHKADVLTLCAAKIDGRNKLFAAGVDPKIVQFDCEEDGTWSDGITTTMHKCDVRAFQVFTRDIGRVEGKIKREVQLISGDASGVVTILQTYKSGFKQVTRMFPIRGVTMHEAEKETLMLTSGSSTLNLWGVKEKGPFLLLRQNPKMRRGIKLTALCEKWIAIADGEIVKIWSYKLVGQEMIVKRLCAVRKRASAISFTKNAQGLLIGQANGQVLSLDLTSDFQGKKIAPDTAIKLLFDIEEPVHQVANSGAMYTCALGIFGTIAVFSKGAVKILPDEKISGSATNAIFFHASIPTQLFCIHTDRTFRIWNIDRLKESSWSETQASILKDTLFTEKHFGHPVITLTFHPVEKGRVVFVCSQFLSSVDLSKPLPKPEKSEKRSDLWMAKAPKGKRALTYTPTESGWKKRGSGKRHAELNLSVKNPFLAKSSSNGTLENKRKDMSKIYGYEFLMGACFRGNGDLILPKVPWQRFNQYYPWRSVYTKFGT